MSKSFLMFRINKSYKPNNVSSTSPEENTSKSHTLIDENNNYRASSKYSGNQVISDVFRGNRFKSSSCGCGKKL